MDEIRHQIYSKSSYLAGHVEYVVEMLNAYRYNQSPHIWQDM
jgi:hypothetical protein